ncbi:MAG: signal peptidase II [Candidatus Moranbacteria bacterium]|nr:signal peptidase II [Candidatus Moranbacteria bacterium]
MSLYQKGLLFIGSFFLFCFLIGIRIFLQGEFFCNTKIGFGFFEYSKGFLFLGLFLFVLIGFFLFKSQHFSLRVIFSILLVAGVANIFERITFGCVLDYITLPFIRSHINMADILITGALGYLLFFTETKDFKK